MIYTWRLYTSYTIVSKSHYVIMYCDYYVSFAINKNVLVDVKFSAYDAFQE